MPPKKNTSTLEPTTDPPLDDLNYGRIESLLIRVTKSITETFNTCIEKLVSSLDQKLSMKLDIQSAEIFEANKRIDSLEKKLLDLQTENGVLRDSTKALTTRVETLTSSNDDLQQYIRGDKVLLHGLPLHSDGSREADCKKTVIDVIN